MSGEVNSASPADLADFVRSARQRRTAAAREVSSVEQLWERVLNGSPHHGIPIDALQTFSRYLGEMVQPERFVQTVREALLAADKSGRPVLSASSAQIRNALKAAGVYRPAIPNFQPRTALPGHPTGGYVDDPIAASTGNMLHAEIDLPFPGFAASLTFGRRYNSRLADTVGAFGPGWSSLLDVRLDETDEGISVALSDGALVLFEEIDDEWVAFGNRLRSFDRADDGTWTVWVDHAQAWLFGASGRCSGWRNGQARVMLEYDDDGRVVAAREVLSGRGWTVEWAGDVIARVVASDGRSADYERDDQGRLIKVVTPAGHHVYEWSGNLLLSVTDADGVREFENAYDADGRVIRQISPFGRVTEYGYHAEGLTVISDERGTRQAMVHDSRANLTAVIDYDGSAMRIAYDDYDRQVRVTSKTGAVTEFSYDDATGDLVARIDPDGLGERWEWDDRGRLVAHTSRSGATRRLEYRGALRTPVRSVDPLGAATEVEVDERLDAPLSVTDPDGVVVRYGRNDDGQVVAVEDAAGARTELSYDPYGTLSQSVNPLGVRTAFVADAAGRLLRDECGAASTSFAYSAAGRVTGLTLPGDVSATTEFGRHGAPVALTDAYGSTLRLNYDSVGNVTEYVAPDGAVYRQDFDPVGRLVRVTDPAGGEIRHNYDAEGNLVDVVDAAGRACTREFDALGRVVKQVAPGGAATLLHYHPDGQLASVRQADESGWETEIDGAGRVVAVVMPDGARARLQWSPGGRLTERTSPGGQTERYEYDARGAVIAVLDADGHRRDLSIDAAGRVTAAVEDGQRMSFEWDDLDQLVGVGQLGALHSFVRDSGGRVLSAVDASGVGTHFRYDRRGQLAEAIDPAGGRTAYEYDVRGRLAAQHAPGGRITNWEYDEVGYPSMVTDPAGLVGRFAHDASGRVTGMAYGASGWSRTLDAAGREVVRASLDGDVLARFAYDPVGRLVEASTPNGAASRFVWGPAGFVTELVTDDGTTLFERDPDGRLISMTQPDGVRTAFEHDDAGSIVGATHDAESEVEFDPAGRLLLGADGVVYRYDDAGRLAEILPPDGDSVSYEYGDDGLITSERGPAGTRHFTYDAAGRVAAIRVDGAGTTLLEYDGAGRRTRELWPDGDSVTYAWSPLDQLVSVTADRSGVVTTTRIEFDALGQLTRINGEPAGADPTIGRLRFLGVRVLDGFSNQFLSADPLLTVPGSNGGASAYTYAWHDPVNFVDPSGMRPISKAEFEEFKNRPETTALGRFWEEHQQTIGYIVAGVVVAAGVVMIATGVGAPIGAAILVGAAVSTAVSVSSGEFNPWHVVIGGVAGGAMAAGGAVIAAASLTGGAATAAMAGVGGVVSAGANIAWQVASGGPVDWSDVAMAGVVGVVTGGVGQHFANAIPQGLPRGLSALKNPAVRRAVVADGVVHGVGDGVEQVGSNLLNGRGALEDFDPRRMGLATAGGAGSTALTHSVPVRSGAAPQPAPPQRLMLPAPPQRLMLPPPPQRLMLPAPPQRLMLPAPPQRLMLPPPPPRLMLPAPPPRLMLPPPQPRLMLPPPRPPLMLGPGSSPGTMLIP